MYIFQSLPRPLAVLFCVFILLFAACKKEEVPGPKGEPGTPGGGGNAGITSTSVFSVAISQWTIDVPSGSRKVTLDFPQITKEVISKGAIKVFIQTSATFSEPAWSELPYVKGDLFTQFGFTEGHLHLNYINIEGSVPPSPDDWNFRMVIYSEVQ